MIKKNKKKKGLLTISEMESASYVVYKWVSLFLYV